MYDYNEEEIRKWEEEGGAFLIREGIIDTDNLEEVKEFKRRIEEEEIEEEEIEKIEGRRSFNIIKIRERSNDKMENEFGDSAYNEEMNENLENLIEEFDGEEIDEELEKVLKEIPEKLKEAIKECYKIFNEFKEDIKELSPELFEAIQLMARLATGKPGLPSKYPYPKLKKSGKAILWSDMLEQMFPDEEEDDDFEKADEKPSREKPWPSFSKEVEKKAKKIEKIEDELEQSSFNPYDRLD